MRKVLRSVCGLPGFEPSPTVTPLKANSRFSVWCCACGRGQSTEQMCMGFDLVQLLGGEAEIKLRCRILRVPFKKKNGEVLQKWVSRCDLILTRPM